MKDYKMFGGKIYVSEYIKFLQREIENLKSETIGHEDAYFKTIPVIEIKNLKVSGAESETLREDDFIGESEFIWEE